MSIFRLLTAGCVAILAAISGMVPGALAAGDEIVIGAPISLTGIFAADGLEQKWGYEQAIAEETSAKDDVAFTQKVFERQQGLLKKGIASQASSALERVGLLRELHGHYREQLVRRNAPIRLERLLDHIFSNPLIGQPEIMEHLGVSRTTAFRYMDHLLSTGMLEPLHPQQNNHRWYVARELLNILE